MNVVGSAMAVFLEKCRSARAEMGTEQCEWQCWVERDERRKGSSRRERIGGERVSHSARQTNSRGQPIESSPRVGANDV